MRKISVLIVVLFAMAASGACRTQESSPGKVVVARVGDFKITREMIDLRIKPQTGGDLPADPQVFALAQLVQGYLAVHIVNRYGDNISDVSARQFWAESRPHFARAISDAVAGQPEALILATFAKPQMALILISEMFERRDYGPEETEYVFRALREIRAQPNDLRKIAARERARVDEVWIGPSKVRLAGPGAPPGADHGDPKLYKILHALEPGTVYSRPVLRPDAFQIYRIEERRGAELRALVVSLPKPSIDDWFWTQVQDYTVDIFDAALREKFITSVPFARRLRSSDGRYPARYSPPRPPGPWRP